MQYTKNDKLFCDMSDSRTIFVDLDQGIFYAFTIFSNLVFRYLISGKTLDETITTIQNIPGMPENIADSVKIAFDKLIEYNLIVESDIPEIVPMFEITETLIQDIRDEDFDPTIQASTDVQKLLMDDPIHDVSADGWTPNIQ